MFDRETGKPRGYGFCEFVDSETAASAIRNLNGYDVGGRNLIVNTADTDLSSASHHTSTVPMTTPPAPVAPAPIIGAAPSFGIDAVKGVLSSLSNQQLSDIIMQFKASERHDSLLAYF